MSAELPELRPAAVSLMVFAHAPDPYNISQNAIPEATQAAADAFDEMGFYIRSEHQLTSAEGSLYFDNVLQNVDQVVIFNNVGRNELPRHSLPLLERAKELKVIAWLLETPPEDPAAIRARQYGARILNLSRSSKERVRDLILYAEADKRSER